MNEWMAYAGMSLLTIALFMFWYMRTQKNQNKQWVLKQSLKNPESSKQLTQALKQSDQSVHRPTVWLVLLIIVPTALFLQLWYFEPPEQISSENQEAPDLATAINQLRSKLANEPNDLAGQLLYARSMVQMQQYNEAVKAYEKANEIQPDNPSTLTDLAEAIAFRSNTGSFLGEPEPLLAKALMLNPTHQKALWLQGIVFQQKQEHTQAVQVWQRLLPLLQSDSVKATVSRQIEQSMTFLGPDQATRQTYQITVNATPEIMNMAPNGNMRLFVYAKEVNGPPMPVAAFPMAPPFQWPITITLADAHSLQAQRPLSQFDELKFSAKLSMTGSATPDAGDLTSDEVITDASQTEITLTLNNN